MKSRFSILLIIGFLLVLCEDGLTQTAPYPKAHAVLHANRLRVGKIAPGIIYWPIQSGPGILNYDEPPAISVDFDAGLMPTAGIEAATLWLGALDSTGQLRVSCPTNKFNKFPFVAGPLTGNWPVDSLNSILWDRFFKVFRAELEYHRADWLDNGVLDHPLPAITGWPGKGNPHFETQYGFPLPTGELAPFADVNSDGIYNAFDGDYPHPAGLQPDVLPGEINWNIFNDQYGDFEGLPLGVEVHQTSWALSCDTDRLLNETVFFSYKIINRSGGTLDSVAVGMRVLPLLGNFYDDGFGTSVDQNAVFVYNIDNTDDVAPYYSKGHFGINPPVFSFACLNRALYKSTFHFVILICDPNPNMTNPVMPFEYFRNLHGYWRDGTPQTYGGTGYDWNQAGNPITDFIFPGDPNSLTEWTYLNNWQLCGFDAAIIPSFYFDQLHPDSVVALDFAFSYHRGPGLNNLQNVSYMYNRLDALQDRYDQQFAGACSTFKLCSSDCVWPGDLNRDGIVNHFDLLPLGVGWGKTGLDRSGLNTWAPHDARDWGEWYNQDYDVKHLDANGDGLLDSLDLKTILLHEGLSVPGYSALPDIYPKGPELLVVHAGQPSVNPNHIKPGDRVVPRVEVKSVPELYGLVFTMEYDTQYWTYNGYGGTVGALRYQKERPGELVVTTVFTNQVSSLDGKSMAAIILWSKTIPDSLPDSTFIRVKNIRGIRADGSEIQLGATALRYCFSGKCAPIVGAKEPANLNFEMYPNPAQGSVTLSAPGQNWEQVDVFDSAGRFLRHWKGTGQDIMLLDLGGLPTGWLFFQVLDAGQVYTFRVLRML